MHSAELEEGSDNGTYQHTLVGHVGIPAGEETTAERALVRSQGHSCVGWEDVMESYLAAAVDSSNTRRAYRRHLRDAFGLLGCETVAEVTGAALADYRADIVRRELAPASKAQALSAMRSFLAWTRTMGVHSIPEEVIKLALRTPRAVVKSRYSSVTEREIQAMMAAAPTTRERALLAVLLGAGLRVAEASALDVSDLLEDEQGGMALLVRQGKGHRDRVVPIRSEVDALLRAYLTQTRRFLGGDGPLFLVRDRGLARRSHQRLGTRAISALVKVCATKAGITAKKISPHALRHTYALRALRAGGNVVALARLLGHASIATTERYVDHLALDELRAAVPALPLADHGNLLSSGPR
jgi:site-specific recombinase XerD